MPKYPDFGRFAPTPLGGPASGPCWRFRPRSCRFSHLDPSLNEVRTVDPLGSNGCPLPPPYYLVIGLLLSFVWVINIKTGERPFGLTPWRLARKRSRVETIGRRSADTMSCRPRHARAGWNVIYSRSKPDPSATASSQRRRANSRRAKSRDGVVQGRHADRNPPETD